MSTTNTIPPIPQAPTPITSRVTVQGRYLVHENTGERFLMRGIAFPIAPISRTEAIPIYNPDGWIAILMQLRQASSKLNTIRLYHLDIDTHDYSPFFEHARLLGFYLWVPLTTDSGDGVLDRNLPAPDCYSPGLYNHGRRILDMTFAQYPNILGGVLGNEVMNSQPTWAAAPCLLAYARDLKRHSPAVPLIYTMQHDGIGAAISPAEAVALTMDYMTTCGTIDVLGVNIESWCSSRQTFELNEDGSVGSYLDLYNHVVNASASIPIVFSEIGCSRELFNRDNGLERYARDWKQLAVVESEAQMGSIVSGFIAYAYDGPPPFRMTQGGPWDGQQPLPFAKDMDNFMTQLEQLKDYDENVTTRTTRTIHGDILDRVMQKPPTCESIIARLVDHGGEPLLGIDQVPSYYVPNEIPLNATVHETPDAAGDYHNSNGGGGNAAVGVVTSMLHDPLQTVLVMMLVMIVVLVPFCRSTLSAWRETACCPNSATTRASPMATTMTSIPNGNHHHHHHPDTTTVTAAGIEVAGRNYDTFT